MASRRNDLAELRAAARKRQQAVNRKISRLENQKDVKLSGSRFDPRRDVNKIDRYNQRQLAAYVAELDTFMSRKTQFVPGVKGTPLPANKYAALQKATAKANAAKLTAYNAVKDVFLPYSGMTADQRQAMITADHPMAGNPSVHSPKKLSRAESKRIPNEKALDKLTKQRLLEASPEYSKKQEKRDRWNVRQVLKATGDKELQKLLNQLDARQFNILYNLTPFMTAITTAYETAARTLMDGKSKAFYNTLESNSKAEAQRLAKWAKTV